MQSATSRPESMVSPTDILRRLWEEAIESFITEAQLSEQEKDFLKGPHSPEEVFEITRQHWQHKVSKKQWRNHVSVQKAMTAVLNIFGVIDTVLNLAQAVCDFRPVENKLISRRFPLFAFSQESLNSFST